MEAFICTTCGAQYPPARRPPESCRLCQDERQYVNRSGQGWTTLGQMAGHYQNQLVEVEPDLLRIDTQPSFGIGQSAFVVLGPGGNLLWDCVSWIDDATVAELQRRGGIQAIAISHPHFYASCTEWSRRFGWAPLYLSAADKDFLPWPGQHVVHFEADSAEPLPGITVARLGGHFHGSTVLHWPAGADGRGVLLTGDTIAVAADPAWVTFLYSFPNRVPLSAAEVTEVVARALRYRFDRIYAAWPADVVASGASQAVRRSAERYTGMLAGTWPRR